MIRADVVHMAALQIAPQPLQVIRTLIKAELSFLQVEAEHGAAEVAKFARRILAMPQKSRQSAQKTDCEQNDESR